MTAVAAIAAPLAAGAGHYLKLGVLSISLTNALVLLAMLVLFVVALLAPFPQHRPKVPRQRAPEDAARETHSDGARP
jgi:hypothetical protein